MELLGKVRDRSVGSSELLQDATPRGIRERGERSIESGRYILNHTVQYLTRAFAGRKGAAINRRAAAWCVLSFILGTAACANRTAATPCAFALPATAGWTTYDEGAFSIQLPAGYVRGQAYSIDSKVGRWTSGAKGITYDFGFYSNPLQQNDSHPFRDLVVCQESAGPGAPRIVRYTWQDGKYGLAAHWPKLRHSSFMGMDESLTVSGRVDKAEDLAEMLAIVRSVRFKVR